MVFFSFFTVTYTPPIVVILGGTILGATSFLLISKIDDDYRLVGIFLEDMVLRTIPRAIRSPPTKWLDEMPIK